MTRQQTAGDAFEREPGFDLNEFASRSFGLFQGDPFDTAWRFAPEAADDAEEFTFHPTQESHREKDGSPPNASGPATGPALSRRWKPPDGNT